jgi:hypothetical protein
MTFERMDSGPLQQIVFPPKEVKGKVQCRVHIIRYKYTKPEQVPLRASGMIDSISNNRPGTCARISSTVTLNPIFCISTLKQHKVDEK